MEFSLETFTEYVRTGVLVLGLLIILYVNDRSKFINVHIFANVGFGIAFTFFPVQTLGFQVTKDLDETALTCSALFGMSLLAASIVWFLTRETRDGTVPVTLMTAQVFSSSVLLLCQLYTQFGMVRSSQSTNPWTMQHVLFGMVGSGALLLCNLFYLLRSHDFTGYPQHNIRVNEYLRIDACLSMLLSLVCLAFPDMLLRHFWPESTKFSSVSKHLVRCAGAMILNTAFVSLQSAGFLHEKDKKHQFIGRLVGLLLLPLPFICKSILSDTFSLYQIEVAMLALVPLAINGVLGYMAGGTSISTANKYR